MLGGLRNVRHIYFVSKRLLVHYIRLALGEAQQARVPNQLLVADEPIDDDESSEDDINEFNAISAGGVMGHACSSDGKREEDDG